MDKKKSSRSIFAYSTIGIELAATIAAFVIGGYKLDEYFNKSPIFISIGAFLGMAIGFYHLIRQLQGIDRAEKSERMSERDGERDEERKKWL